MIDKTREIALKILYKIDKEQAYSNIVLNEEIKQNTQEDIYGSLCTVKSKILDAETGRKVSFPESGDSGDRCGGSHPDPGRFDRVSADF